MVHLIIIGNCFEQTNKVINLQAKIILFIFYGIRLERADFSFFSTDLKLTSRNKSLYTRLITILGSGALPGKMLIVRIIEDIQIDAYFRSS